MGFTTCKMRSQLIECSIHPPPQDSGQPTVGIRQVVPMAFLPLTKSLRAGP